MVKLVTCALKLPADMEFRAIEGHIWPGKAQGFASPQSKNQDQNEGRVKRVTFISR